ncbi:phosphoglycolate phosphatase [Pseudorhodoplanes sinuspersici]|uniref:Phosphoglycolate phosphatase n=1 Tax=Pseudorhodoplanes sinuspersici TaxID=1235591 RepID=A0A1W6ZUP5_9HYPH|nr:phosphoglycolate phosphatase [Pseudorhodoplanes sinuspersici]ARQ01104.1 phosphoglycolate phosphatase [Pseudorhodoplanes sinuspersici]RKE72753.1 phosphoglycolate phosphatase [Pseudorhodoplanes sinuspersici]
MSNPIIVFDLDGTLVDTAPDLIATLNLVLTLENIPPVPFEKARAMIGGGVRPLIEEALIEQQRHLGEAAVDALFEQYVRHYQEHIADHSRPYPGCEDVLEVLGAQGFTLAVCTNKYESLSVRLLDALDMKAHFAAICGQDTFPMKKPDPEMLIRTIQHAGGDISRAVMVGDSDTDVRTARAAGIPIIGVDFGYTDIPMAKLSPDRLVSHFEQLPALVMELVPATSSVN